MKKNIVKIVILMAVLCYMFTDKRCVNATTFHKLGMNQSMYISENDVSPASGHYFTLPNVKHKVRIIIRNLVASGTIEYYGADKAVVSFTNVSTYNDFYVSLSIGLDDEPKTYDIKQGQSELVIETTLANEDLDNDISISPQTSIHMTNDGGYVHYTNYSYTIELQDLGYEQTSSSTKVGKVLQQEDAYAKKCLLRYSIKDGTDKIRVYRKSTNTGKYKLVQTKTLDGSEDEDYRGALTISDKGLKPNSKYWYQITTKLSGEEAWSKQSNAKVYWTAPAKVKAKKSGNILKWNKVKGANSYMVTEFWRSKVGYNIFGQLLTDEIAKSYFTNNRKYSLKHNVYSYSVYPITKHNGYYYMDGEEVVKKKSYLKFYAEDRYVG